MGIVINNPAERGKVPTMPHLQSIPPGLASVANGRDTLPTHEAAHALNRASQTLRKWACLENGPIRPVRIHGRLAWRVSDLAEVLSGSQK